MAERARAGVDPGRAYEERLAARRARLERLDREAHGLALTRLSTALAAVALGAVAWESDVVSPWWITVPVAVFAAAVVVHARNRGRRREAGRAVRYYERGLDRLAGVAESRGPEGTAFGSDAHPYASDLDLFGPGSVFARIVDARTAVGEETLAEWLEAPAPIGEARRRQAAIEELRDRVDLRESLAVLAEAVSAESDPSRVARWAAAPPTMPSNVALRPVAFGLVAISLAACIGWGVGVAGAWPALAALGVQAAFALSMRKRVFRVLDGVQDPEHDLEVLAEVLGRIEREPFESELLVEIDARLVTDGTPPSARIRELARRVDLANARRNQMFLPISWFLLWATHSALALEAWRLRHGSAVARWIEAVGTFEALSSLAAYAFERPRDPFPELVDDGPVLEAEALGHPLIPDDRRVANDVSIGHEPAMWVVSGSNMSGKSTLLRAVGVNVVLALAGAPVCARRMRVSPLAIGASMRIQDSLQAGASKFYAEITRLRTIVDLASGDRPALFLLDEILAGTNSHDRAAGAEAVLSGLLARGAIGLVTTHDLALARLAERLAPRASNVHFEDRFEDGRLHFDYRLRPGVVERSNALELMRSVGLEV